MLTRSKYSVDIIKGSGTERVVILLDTMLDAVLAVHQVETQ